MKVLAPTSTIQALNQPPADSGHGGGGHTIPADIWEQLLEGAAVEYAAPGDPIYLIGHARQPAAILSGIVRVFIVTPSGRQVTTRYARPGQLIGLVPPLTGGDVWEARAVTGVRAAAVPLDHIEAVGRRRPEVLWAILQATAIWSAAAIARVADVAGGPMTPRIARHLLDLGLPGPDGKVVAHASHLALAEAVGTAREVVTRTLRTFRIHGLVETRVGSIIITDPERLARVAAGGSLHA